MATKKVTSWKKYGNWILEKTIPDFQELVKLVAAVTAPTHPADHEFSESSEFPGTCSSCGWIDPATETDCPCPKTLADHVRVLPSVIAEVSSVDIEVVVIPLPQKGGRLH